MTRSHKVLILVPPLLLGMTAIVVFFSWQHNQNQQAASKSEAQSATSSEYVITEPVPLPLPTNKLPPRRPLIVLQQLKRLLVPWMPKCAPMDLSWEEQVQTVSLKVVRQ